MTESAPAPSPSPIPTPPPRELPPNSTPEEKMQYVDQRTPEFRVRLLQLELAARAHRLIRRDQ
jgi:hypothetical protein